MKKQLLGLAAIASLSSSVAEATQLPLGSAYVESDGVVVGEAENFHARSTGTGVAAGIDWLVVPDEASADGGPFVGPRCGQFIQALPDSPQGSNINGGGWGADGPTIDYTLDIQTTGTYQLYLRWDGHDMASDSIFAGILELQDGVGGSIADWYQDNNSHLDADFTSNPWDGFGGFEANFFNPPEHPMLFTFGAPGDYTLRFQMREDGAAIDAWALQLQTLAPPMGDGPETSAIRAVPAALIAELILFVIELDLQNGIEVSLDAKLDTALAALDDASVNNDQAACNSLQAFINAVEAQRGNKLTDVDADCLIADAQAIIDLICSP